MIKTWDFMGLNIKKYQESNIELFWVDWVYVKNIFLNFWKKELNLYLYWSKIEL
jgi:hypothetical protein